MPLLAAVQGADFHRDTEHLSEELMPALDFRMDAAALEARHFGEVSCRDFRESVLAVLPHRCALSMYHSFLLRYVYTVYRYVILDYPLPDYTGNKMPWMLAASCVCYNCVLHVLVADASHCCCTLRMLSSSCLMGVSAEDHVEHASLARHA